MNSKQSSSGLAANAHLVRRSRRRVNTELFNRVLVSFCAAAVTGSRTLLFQTNFWRCFTIAGKKELEINEGIRDKEVRVIDADGTQLGIMSVRDAQRRADEKNLDLVKIAPQAQPPVCKILDYGKYRFELQKRDKEAKKNQKVVDIKEIRLSLNIDTNDFNTKVNQAAKFLAKGDKVKVSIRFRGREMAHTNLGLDVHKRFAEALPSAVVEKQPKLEGRSMQMFLAPAPSK